MARKIFSILSILLLLSCKHTNTEVTEETTDNATNSKAITERDISQLNYLDFSVDEKVMPIVEPWQEYVQLSEIINNVKTADLSYFKTDGAEENLKNLLTGFKENIPDTINTPSISARITVVETALFKTESISNLSNTKKEELVNTLKELLESFSNLNFQMNKKLEKDSRNIEKPE
ncbi:hypothetical protein KO566_00065 [Flavobacteriaceae bacterium XHP0103]|uniref:hypothetical protein n=1 Tax=Marixanthotalea marina TaxID=2844359 RepID=UPI002989D292|nr:hypothetical protein [Marixanthotalea marina]MBU3820438.1 hypothetical protein [Marixanthotalea marina]